MFTTFLILLLLIPSCINSHSSEAYLSRRNKCAKHIMYIISCIYFSNSAESGWLFPLYGWGKRGVEKKVTRLTKIKELAHFRCNQMFCSKTSRKQYTYSQIEISWANQEAIRGLWSNYRETLVLKLKWFVQETYLQSIHYPPHHHQISFNKEFYKPED